MCYFIQIKFTPLFPCVFFIKSKNGRNIQPLSSCRVAFKFHLSKMVNRKPAAAVISQIRTTKVRGTSLSLRMNHESRIYVMKPECPRQRTSIRDEVCDLGVLEVKKITRYLHHFTIHG